MKNTALFIAIGIGNLSLLISGISLYKSYDEGKKVCYIRTLDFMQQYQGMVDARDMFGRKEKRWSQTLDSINKSIELAVNQFRMDSLNLSYLEMNQRLRQLQLLNKHAQLQSEQLVQKAKDEKDSMTSGIIAQANEYLKKYGEEKGYKIIFGTNNTGTMLYAEDAIDITEEALAAINNYYETQL